MPLPKVSFSKSGFSVSRTRWIDRTHGCWWLHKLWLDLRNLITETTWSSAVCWPPNVSLNIYDQPLTGLFIPHRAGLLKWRIKFNGREKGGRRYSSKFCNWILYYTTTLTTSTWFTARYQWRSSNCLINGSTYLNTLNAPNKNAVSRVDGTQKRIFIFFFKLKLKEAQRMMRRGCKRCWISWSCVNSDDDVQSVRAETYLLSGVNVQTISIQNYALKHMRK